MDIKEIKKEMIAWRDFYGGDLLGVSEVSKAKTKEELKAIIDKHETHMELMLNDAISHINNFKKKIGLHQ